METPETSNEKNHVDKKDDDKHEVDKDEGDAVPSAPADAVAPKSYKRIRPCQGDEEDKVEEGEVTEEEDKEAMKEVRQIKTNVMLSLGQK